jgi:hypothetical protein
MKSLSPALQAHLIEATTTLSWCWTISRADGVVFGFTDHDRVLTFGGVDYEPESGFVASEIRAGSDLSVDAQDAEGVLTSTRITETGQRRGDRVGAGSGVCRIRPRGFCHRLVCGRHGGMDLGGQCRAAGGGDAA